MEFFKKSKFLPGALRRGERYDSLCSAFANDVYFRRYEYIHGYVGGNVLFCDVNHGCIYGRYDDLVYKFPNFHDNSVFISMF